jgi:hypothetical protein
MGVASGTHTGIAMSATEEVFSNSKAMVIDYLTAVFKTIKFDEIDVPVVNWKVKHLKFHTVKVYHKDIDIEIDGDEVKVHMKHVGGSFTGETEAPKIWPASGHTRAKFEFECHRGGFEKIEIHFKLTKQFVDGRTLPAIDVKYAHFDFDDHKFSVDIHSDDAFMKTGGYLANAFKKPFITVLTPILNVGFPSMANMAF